MFGIAYVKAELTTRLATRLGSAVHVGYAPPITAGDFTGDDPAMHLAVYPLPASASADNAEVGAGYVRHDITATLPIVCRVEALTTSSAVADVDAELEALVGAVLAEVAADPTLGYAPGGELESPTLTNLWCTVSGWDQDTYQLADPPRWAGQVTVAVDITCVAKHPTT